MTSGDAGGGAGAAAHVRPPRDVRRRRTRRRCRRRRRSTTPTARWSARCPRALRALAERLPWRLGLTQSPDGGWSDFVGLHPNRALPVYAAQAPDGDAGRHRRPTCVRYLRAHHIGGFTWLLRDRLEDGQVASPTDGLFELAEVFEQRWREALARRRPATRRWRSAVPPRRRALAARDAGREAAARRRLGARADLRGDRAREAELDRRAVAGAAAGARRSRGA